MAREELIASAVSFLRDPSVATSPIEKRIDFLRTKNLTQPEIDLALSRASPSMSPSSTSTAPQSSTFAPSQSQPGGAPQYPPQASHLRYPPNPYYDPRALTAPAPAPPYRRDWRDHFITATLATSLSYLAYTLFKRYLHPLLAPPTVSQLATDKASLDADFARAFALLEKLQCDTEALKAAEQARTERLDRALEQLEGAIKEARENTRRRDEELLRVGEKVGGLRSKIEEGLEGCERKVEERLTGLGSDVRSLGLLMNSRLGGLVNGNGHQGPPAAGSAAVGAAKGEGRVREESRGSGGGKVGNADRKAEFDAGRRGDGAGLESQPGEEPDASAAAKGKQAAVVNGGRPSKAAIPAWQLADSEAEASGEGK